ncbi:TonB-dependent receptor [Poseidonibacter lekithochrous]|uniref:TonB-dependent receptor plug domain-containing protein n=1 Tax=Poseidonibacter TaxID=2321187 RepID=UPI001C095AAA|nr:MULTISPECIES: TonB-dependent receptor [Poseidonibacter]MBU3014068.1 TonB-dependent receptor [Poseidonibacter lekithochrous]MDO6827365.1 TonB-dependent receptor [Poseidonibacter sp. 1_MG-2023]
MKRIISLSLLSASVVLQANETTVLDQISVVEKANGKIVKDISNEQIKSADLAEALTKNISSISIVRRSGIANDIILRGQKKDNINILIDNAKIYGACPNRMDPVTSHVLSNNIESVKVIEGPYDVENFGTLSGNVIVKTKQPSKDLKAEVNLGAGSFGYKKASAMLSGGTDKFKLLVSTSIEKGDQYEDGDGNDFLEQQLEKGVMTGNQYSKSDLEAYEKKTVLTKAIFNITDDQDIKLSYTANRSDNVLYPNTPMDADYDDSDIYTIGYTARDLGAFSKELTLDYYYSHVDHPMSTKLRNSGSEKYMTNHMKSSIWGSKLKNSLEVADSLVTIGLDTSVRNWRGKKYMTSSMTGMQMPSFASLDSTDTTNKAVFTSIEKSFGKLDLEMGARYDYTDIDSINADKTDKKYTSLNANIFAIYNADENTKYFAGIGKSSRVPDARELYMGANNDLDDTKNYEVDLGFDKTIGNFNIKSKVFYSVLKDYIYNTGTFENIDANIYGLDISGFYYMNDKFSIDYGASYQRGEKDDSAIDKDLAEIPPLKANIAFNYEEKNSRYTAEIMAVDRWNTYDSSAKEQELAGYALVNLKYSNQLHKNFGLTFGVDNVFDKTYASTNTYQDVTYVETGGDRVLLNDPGRYFYANLKYSF